MRTVALVGFAEHCNRPAYSLPDDVELWSVNHAFMYGFPRLDRVIDIHNIKHILDPHYYADDLRDEYLDWLSQPHPFKIYMQEQYPEYPASVRYPIEDAIKLVGGKRHLSSSLPYMMALVVLEGDIERVEWYGFNMEGEYSYQRTDAYYWKGRAEAIGIEVYIPPESSLSPKESLYGYEGYSMISRQAAEAHKAFYESEKQVNERLKYKQEGILDERMRMDGKDEEAINDAMMKVQQYDRQEYMARGSVLAIQNLIDTCDLPEVELDIEVGDKR